MNTPATTLSEPDRLTGPSVKPVSTAAEAGDTMVQSLYTLIADQPFFKGLDPQHLQLLTDSAMEVRFDAGESIFQEASPANRFYLILEGKVVLGAEREEHGLVPIQTLGPGDDLGWSWLFPPYYLHLSARAIEPTHAIFFYGTRLREHCEQDSHLGYQLTRRIAEVVIHQLRATQERLMERLAPCEGPKPTKPGEELARGPLRPPTQRQEP